MEDRAEPATRTVWGVGTPRTLRAHWTLHELGLAYGTRAVQARTGETQTAEYLALDPRGKIPLLVEDDFVLAESGAIVSYLADHYEPGKLAPLGGSRERATHDQWLHFTLMELDATSLYVVRRHGGLPEIYGAAPVAVEGALTYFQRQLAVAEAQLQDGRPYLLGADFQVADLVLTTVLDWARFLDQQLPERLAAFRDRIIARPAYQAAMKENFPPEVFAAASRSE